MVHIDHLCHLHMPSRLTERVCGLQERGPLLLTRSSICADQRPAKLLRHSLLHPTDTALYSTIGPGRALAVVPGTCHAAGLAYQFVAVSFRGS